MPTRGYAYYSRHGAGSGVMIMNEHGDGPGICTVGLEYVNWKWYITYEARC
jgi:hypothetical protein